MNKFLSIFAISLFACGVCLGSEEVSVSNDEKCESENGFECVVLQKRENVDMQDVHTCGSDEYVRQVDNIQDFFDLKKFVARCVDLQDPFATYSSMRANLSFLVNHEEFKLTKSKQREIEEEFLANASFLIKSDYGYGFRFLAILSNRELNKSLSKRIKSDRRYLCLKKLKLNKTVDSGNDFEVYKGLSTKYINCLN